MNYILQPQYFAVFIWNFMTAGMNLKSGRGSGLKIKFFSGSKLNQKRIYCGLIKSTFSWGQKMLKKYRLFIFLKSSSEHFQMFWKKWNLKAINGPLLGQKWCAYYEKSAYYEKVLIISVLIMRGHSMSEKHSENKFVKN